MTSNVVVLVCDGCEEKLRPIEFAHWWRGAFYCGACFQGRVEAEARHTTRVQKDERKRSNAAKKAARTRKAKKAAGRK